MFSHNPGVRVPQVEYHWFRKYMAIEIRNKTLRQNFETQASPCLPTLTGY
jgi:hypothetical protein